MIYNEQSLISQKQAQGQLSFSIPGAMWVFADMVIANHRAAGWGVRRVAGMWRDLTLQITLIQGEYGLRKLCSDKSAITPPLATSTLLQLQNAVAHFSYALSTAAFSYHGHVSLCAISSSSSPIHKFSLTALSLFRQEGPLYFLRCLRVPGPACLCTVCVFLCVCVSQLENSCHIQPSHAAQLRPTATVNFLHLYPYPYSSFINNSITDFFLCRYCAVFNTFQILVTHTLW